MIDLTKTKAIPHSGASGSHDSRDNYEVVPHWYLPQVTYGASQSLLLMIGYMALYLAKPDVEYARFYQAIWGFSLALVTCTCTRMLYPFVRVYLNLFSSTILVVAFAMLLVVAIDVSWVSLGSGFVGALLGLRHRMGEKSFFRSRIHIALSILLVAINLQYLSGIADEVAEKFEPGNLFNASHQTQLGRLDSRRADIVRTKVPDFYGGSVEVLQVQLDYKLEYSGFRLVHFNQNWKEHQRLHLRLYNPPERPLAVLGLRVNDRAHELRDIGFGDRFDTILKLDRGWNAFEFSMDEILHVPSGRVMDAANISNVEVFAAQPKPGDAFYIEGIWLD